jgi:hypothetical protein
MQQVADWLEKLGLGQYAQRFAENDISFALARWRSGPEPTGRSLPASVAAAKAAGAVPKSRTCWVALTSGRARLEAPAQPPPEAPVPKPENARLLPRLDLFAAGFLSGLARGADDRTCGRR